MIIGHGFKCHVRMVGHLILGSSCEGKKNRENTTIERGCFGCNGRRVSVFALYLPTQLLTVS